MDEHAIIACLHAAQPLTAKLHRAGLDIPLTAEDQRVLDDILEAGLAGAFTPQERIATLREAAGLSWYALLTLWSAIVQRDLTAAVQAGIMDALVYVIHTHYRDKVR